MKYYKVILKTGSTVVMSTGDAFDIQAACKNIPDSRYEEISEAEFNAFAEANKCYNENLREIVTRWNVSTNNQRKTDIEKACEWLNDNLMAFVEYDHLNGICIDYSQLNKQFRTAMEKKLWQR